MKRSEMIRIIGDSIEDHVDSYPPLDEIAEKILKTLEEKGMKPPVISGVKIPIGYDGQTGEVAAWDTSGRPVNAWEPEDV